MAKKSKGKPSSEETIRTIRRATGKKYTADDKIRIVLEGVRGESGIRELCRREGIATNLYYSWSKEFLEAGKQRLVGDTQRQATSREVGELRAEVDQLKHLVAELSVKNRLQRRVGLSAGRHRAVVGLGRPVLRAAAGQ
jgi:transposase